MGGLEVLDRLAQPALGLFSALLPRFGGKGMYGMNVHRAVLETGVPESGVTIHWVDEEYDRGAIVAQQTVPVLPHDTPEELAMRVLVAEHELYPRTVDRICAALRPSHTEPKEVS